MFAAAAAVLATVAVQADTTLTIADGVTLELVQVPAGRFVMGLPDATDAPSHPVDISRPFWIGRTEVTAGQWGGVMGAPVEGRPSEPARGMSWYEIHEFLARLSDRVEGWRFRLPTEAEWEYAARAGTTTAWSSGDDTASLRAHAWTRENAIGRLRDVATREPNPWGLYDVHGNAWEWVSDWYAPDAYGNGPRSDPSGPSSGSEKVRRGGSALYGPWDARSGHRYRQPPSRGNGNIGFRLVGENGGGA